MVKRALIAILCTAVLFSSCGLFQEDAAGDPGADAADVSVEDEDYDFSVFFGHAEDSIAVARIALRYKAETGVSVRPIMTAEDAADDRFLTRYLNSADPPAAFVLPTDAKEAVSASGIGWRFHGRGFAADRRMLADLIGAEGAAAPAVDDFVRDIRLSDYREWSVFLDGLDAYIRGTAYPAITLNGRAYAFAATKGRYSSRLNGVFAVSGAAPAFVGTMLMDMASVTSDTDALDDSRLLATPQAFAAVSPVFDAYIEALGAYTSRIGGLYAPGVRGDDFINGKIYSAKYTDSVFVGGRAVFTPFDSEDYAARSVDVTQAGYIVLLPVKTPLREHWLRTYLGGAMANSSLQMRTQYSLCVNEETGPDTREKAQAFVDWLIADTESSDTVQRCLAAYHAEGAELPLPSGQERGDGVSAFGEEAHENVLAPMLSDPEWLPDEILSFRDALGAAWLSGSGGGP
jgi:hypothetical protein